jgi:hypothetical protein
MEVESCSRVPSIRYDTSTRLSSITVRVECFAIQVTYGGRKNQRDIWYVCDDE